MTNILIIGKNGQVGQALPSALAHLGAVTVLDRQALDLTDEHALRQTIRSYQPQIIVNAAAFTAVDRAEDRPDLAYQINATAPAIMAQMAQESDALLVHYSTDYVFDGSKKSAYVETDAVNPQSVYGASKLAGEQALRDVDLTVRISWVCGFQGANMVKTILRIAAAQPELTFVNDQIGNPTFADDAAGMIATLVEHEQRGIFHVTNQGAVSWHGFAQEVLRAAGLDPARVAPVLTADLQPPRPAPRPANSVLENAALAQAGFTLLDDFRIPLARLVRRLNQ